VYINYTMPDKKISEFNTFTGATGSDVFFVIASGEAGNANAKNYRVPFDVLYSDLGLDAGGGGAVIGGDSDNIDFGGTEPGDVRNINFQQGGENVMVIGSDGNLNLKNNLHVSGGVSSTSGSFETINISDGLTVSGGVSSTSGSFETINISDGLTVSGGVSSTSGSFETINISDGLTVSGGVSGDYVSGKTGVFSDVLLSSTGYFREIIVSGDAYVSGDLHVKGTTHVHEIIDTTVSGTVSGYTGIFNTASGKTGSFTESLTISGVPVSTGAGGTVGGKPVVGGDSENIDFGGTEPGDVRNINFQQGGENVMVIDGSGDVNIQNDLYVSGNISGDIISGKTGVFTESLTVSGVSVITGNQQPSIQWLEDIGGGEITVKEEPINGVNFVYSKWHDSTIAPGDIFYNDGKVGVNNEDPQSELDVSGDIHSDRVKIGSFLLYTDANGNLVFDS
jgi:hypothetical protein